MSGSISPLDVGPEESEILVPEIAELSRRFPESERAPYHALAEAVAGGAVPEEHQPLLAQILQVSIESGRFRHRHGPHAEMRANRLFMRTARGRDLKAGADAVNNALRSLAGQRLDQMQFSIRGPQAIELILDTDQCRLQIALDRSGVRVRSLETKL